jgi:hypothetical protein
MQSHVNAPPQKRPELEGSQSESERNLMSKKVSFLIKEARKCQEVFAVE